MHAGKCSPFRTRSFRADTHAHTNTRAFSRAARHAGNASPSGAPPGLRFWPPRGCPKTPPSQEPPRPCEDGGDSGPAFLKRLRWNHPQLRGRSGSLTRTGKRCGGKRPVSASCRLRRLIASPLATGSRVTASCCSRYCSTRRSASAFWFCDSSSASTSSWSAVLCLTASSAGADRGARGASGLGLAQDRTVTAACVPRFVVRTMCAVLGLVARQEDSGLRDHRVRVLISNHVTPFDHNIVNLLTTCSTVSGGRGRERHRVAP